MYGCHNLGVYGIFLILFTRTALKKIRIEPTISLQENKPTSSYLENCNML